MSRILPRFTQHALVHDPLAIAVAQQEAKRQAAIDHINAGTHTPVDPADLRGIPCIARGVGGTSPGTNPATAVLDLDRKRTRPA